MPPVTHQPLHSGTVEITKSVESWLAITDHPDCPPSLSRKILYAVDWLDCSEQVDLLIEQKNHLVFLSSIGELRYD